MLARPTTGSGRHAPGHHYGARSRNGVFRLGLILGGIWRWRCQRKTHDRMVGRPVPLSRSECLWRSYVRSAAARGRMLSNRLVIGDRTPARPFEVVVLAVLERPEK